jgi:GH25 family lysozyme M1 (1,4-beta-N-acetylmuramidase)
LISGHDISHWQGRLSQANIDKFKAAGDKFFQVKFSQGTGYRDPDARANTELLQSAGFKVGPYHFVTTDNAIAQYNWFAECVQGIQFDLPPWMDVEYYNSASRLQSGQGEAEVEILTELRQARPAFTSRLRAVFGATIPSESVVDSLGMRMTTWMLGQSKLGWAPFPAIYTNVGSGNAVFRSASMKRYLLVVANWGVATPILPTIWKGQKWYIWQDKVEDGAPYGIAGQIDHDMWGELLPFPGDTPPPPADEYQYQGHIAESDRTIKGVLK